MADPILHIKDAYFFEIPKNLWAYNFQSYDEVKLPVGHANLVKLAQDHHLSIGDFNKALDGKILIPQPVATLKNLYEKESGFAISKYMLLELLAAAIVCWLFIRLANRIAREGLPKGRAVNLLESMLLFVRDQIVRPVIGEHHHDEHGHDESHEGHHEGHALHSHGVLNGDEAGHEFAHSEHKLAAVPDHAAHVVPKVGHGADRLLPLFWTMFFFILMCNLLGMIPWLGAPTSELGVTFGLACVTFAATLSLGMMTFGPLKWWWYQVPKMDLPWYVWPLKLGILVIELLGLVIKHLILSVRLLANMVAGHLVLLGIMALIVGAATTSTGMWAGVTTASVIGSTLFSCLELFVAFLQAYVFTLLSTLFIGAAMHRH